jgi:hypothetical protein
MFLDSRIFVLGYVNFVAFLLETDTDLDLK